MTQLRDRYSRQSFLGSESNRVFKNCSVAIVGLGGGGSHVVQQLSHLGIGNFQIYDGDKVEFSNLNRLIGASLDDAREEILKVKVASGMILAINPKAKVQLYACDWQMAAESIREADVIISCIDSYAGRQDIEVTARRYLIPLIDIGMDVFLDGQIPHIAGQVILSVPNGPCFRCLGFLNDENLRREADQYGDAGGRPQVVWANGVLASLAVGIAVDLLTGWNGFPREGEYLHFDGNRNKVFQSPRLEYAPSECFHFPIDCVGDPVFE